MPKRRFLSLFFLSAFFLFTSTLCAGVLDSIRNRIKNAGNDSVKTMEMVALAYAYSTSSQSELAEKHYREAFAFAAKSPVKWCFRYAARKMALFLYVSGDSKNFEEVKTLSEQVIEESVKYSDDRNRAFALRNLALLDMSAGDYNKAILKQLDVLKVFENEGDKTSMASTYGDLAAVYWYSKNLVKAEQYWTLSLTYSLEINNLADAAITTSNLATLYLQSKELTKAEESIKKSMEICERIGNKSLYATNLMNLANLNFERHNYDLAVKYTEECIQLNHDRGDINAEARAMSNLLEMLKEAGKLKEAKELALRVEKILPEIISPDEQVDLLSNLASYYSAISDFKKAYEFKDACVRINDSVYNADLINQASDLEKKYETEKKEKENLQLQSNLDKEQAESAQHKLLLYLSIPLVLFFVALAVVLFRQNKNKMKANQLLNQKNVIIEEKSKIVEAQNKDITDSIHYAKRIQTALLPPDKLWYSILPDSFVLYQPKDILCGDFYWIEETATHVFFAAADCTGHGVPGALMSIVNFNLLNKAVLEKNLSEPSAILNAVNIWLTEALHQTYLDAEVKDGMDISLCVIDKKAKTLTYSGANNPVYLIRNRELQIIDPDDFPVGAYIDSMPQLFSDKKITIQQGDIIYLFSDGYADQFGGPKMKKYKYKQLQAKLLSMQDMTLQRQKHALLEEFHNWKGNLEQIDDVLIIGVNLFTV